jgi:hypothetical protein
VREFATEIFNAPENMRLFDIALQDATPGSTNYLTLLLASHDQPLPVEHVLARIDAYIRAGRHERLSRLLSLARFANIDGDLECRLVQQLAVKRTQAIESSWQQV